MTEYSIHEDSTGVSVEFSRVDGNRRQLLDALKDCREGRCSCPTDEYEKLASMEVAVHDDRMEIVLKPRDGSTFDMAEIAACLDHTIGEPAKLQLTAQVVRTPPRGIGQPGSP